MNRDHVNFAENYQMLRQYGFLSVLGLTVSHFTDLNTLMTLSLAATTKSFVQVNALTLIGKNMGNVINLDLEKELAQKYRVYGQLDFMLCDCADPAPGFHPLVMHDAQGCFVCALICKGCGNDIEVEFGRPKLND